VETCTAPALVSTRADRGLFRSPGSLGHRQDKKDASNVVGPTSWTTDSQRRAKNEHRQLGEGSLCCIHLLLASLSPCRTICSGSVIAHRYGQSSRIPARCAHSLTMGVAERATCRAVDWHRRNRRRGLCLQVRCRVQKCENMYWARI
jgi:hypothetical protein